MAAITIADVRAEIEDEDATDNPLDSGLSFTDPQIERAMRRIAMTWARIPPPTVAPEWDAIPAELDFFFDGIVSHLYAARLAKWKRNEIVYDAGGVTASIDSARIRSLDALRKELMDSFLAGAVDYKRGTHWNANWIGAVG